VLRLLGPATTLSAAIFLFGSLGMSAAQPKSTCPTGAPEPPHCQATAFGDRAAEIAAGYVGQRSSLEAVNESNPGGWWSGKCLSFAHAVYANAGGDVARHTDASDEYRRWLRLGQIHTDLPPPPGAEVFWPGGRWGHVAISVGGGFVVTTEGGPGDRRMIDTRRVRYFDDYAGWALPY
jgi:hypothetical protein